MFYCNYFFRYDTALEHVENAICRAKTSNVTALPAIMCNKATIKMYSGESGFYQNSLSWFICARFYVVHMLEN